MYRSQTNNKKKKTRTEYPNIPQNNCFCETFIYDDTEVFTNF